MPQRAKVVNALRFLNKTPRIPGRGIQYIGRKLQETEEEPGQTQQYLKAAYQYIRKNSQTSPMLSKIRQLSTSIRKLQG